MVRMELRNSIQAKQQQQQQQQQQQKQKEQQPMEQQRKWLMNDDGPLLPHSLVPCPSLSFLRVNGHFFSSAR